MVVGIFAPTFQWIVFFGSICFVRPRYWRWPRRLCGILLDTKNVDQRECRTKGLTKITDSWQSTSNHPPDSYEMCEPISELLYLKTHQTQPPGKPCKEWDFNYQPVLVIIGYPFFSPRRLEACGSYRRGKESCGVWVLSTSVELGQNLAVKTNGESTIHQYLYPYQLVQQFCSTVLYIYMILIMILYVIWFYII